MNGSQQLFKRGHRGHGTGALTFSGLITLRRRRGVDQEFLRGLLERQALTRMRWTLGLDLTRQVGDRLLEVGIVPGDRQRGAVLHQCFWQRATPMVRIGKSANGRKVFRRALEDVFEFLLRFIEQLQFDECPSERDARGQIGGMDRETRTADVYGFLKHGGAAVLFCELREGNRRRVQLDPSSQIIEA
jgi:hypothetical protein